MTPLCVRARACECACVRACRVCVEEVTPTTASKHSPVWVCVCASRRACLCVWVSVCVRACVWVSMCVRASRRATRVWCWSCPFTPLCAGAAHSLPSLLGVGLALSIQMACCLALVLPPIRWHRTGAVTLSCDLWACATLRVACCFALVYLRSLVGHVPFWMAVWCSAHEEGVRRAQGVRWARVVQWARVAVGACGAVWCSEDDEGTRRARTFLDGILMPIAVHAARDPIARAFPPCTHSLTRSQKKGTQGE